MMIKEAKLKETCKQMMIEANESKNSYSYAHGRAGGDLSNANKIAGDGARSPASDIV